MVIVRPGARPVAGAGDDYRIALEILRDVVATHAEDRCTGGRPTQLSVYVAPAPGGGGTTAAEG
ncbi:hypothetical protein [Streptomyces litmocidini]|uniref:hypothetical protein n=1 Tax=Streptomyces litmocidini TaxID=67318 RepID=UPI003702F8B4